MPTSRHRLFRLKFDFAFPESADHQRLQDRISRLARAAVSHRIDSVFAELCAEHALLKVDRLELNIGEIPMDRLEEELPVRTERALREALSPYLEDSREMAPVDLNPVPSGSLEVLAHFFRSGAFPWWSRTGFAVEGAAIFNEAVENEPEALAVILRTLLESESIRRRIVYSLDERGLLMVLELVAPPSHGIIGQLIRSLQALHDRQPILCLGTREFRNIVWELALANRSGAFNAVAFLRGLLSRLSQQPGWRADSSALIRRIVRDCPLAWPVGHTEAEILKLLTFLPEDADATTRKESNALADELAESELETLFEGLSPAEWQLAACWRKAGDLSAFPSLSGETVFWGKWAGHLWRTDRGRLIGTIEALELGGSNGREYLAAIPAELARQMIAVFRPALEGRIRPLQTGFEHLAKQGLVPGWSSVEIGKVLQSTWLPALAGTRAAEYDDRGLLRLLLSQLASGRGLSVEEFVATLLTGIASSTEPGCLYSPLVDALERLQGEHSKLDPSLGAKAGLISSNPATPPDYDQVIETGESSSDTLEPGGRTTDFEAWDEKKSRLWPTEREHLFGLIEGLRFTEEEGREPFAVPGNVDRAIKSLEANSKSEQEPSAEWWWRLWRTNRERLLERIEGLSLRGEAAREYLILIPADLARQIYQFLQPVLAAHIAHLQHDLEHLAGLGLVPGWTPARIKEASQVNWLILLAGRKTVPCDELTLLRSLLSEMARGGGRRFEEVAKDLLWGVSNGAEPPRFHSGIADHLEAIVSSWSCFPGSGDPATAQTQTTRVDGRPNPSLLPRSQAEQRFLTERPIMARFAESLLTDLGALVPQFVEIQRLPKLNFDSLEQVVWKSLLAFSEDRGSQDALVLDCLERLASHWNISVLRVFEWLDAALHETASGLRLARIWSALLKEARGRHAILSSSREVTESNSGPEIGPILDLRTFEVFLRTQELPPGLTLDGFRGLVRRIIWDAQYQLRVWLRVHFSDPVVRDRLTTHLSEDLLVPLLEVFELGSGYYAHALRQYLIAAKLFPPERRLLGRGYWRLVFEILSQQCRAGFGVRTFVAHLLRGLCGAEGLKYEPWLKDRALSMGRPDVPAARSIHAVIGTEAHFVSSRDVGERRAPGPVSEETRDWDDDRTSARIESRLRAVMEQDSERCLLSRSEQLFVLRWLGGLPAESLGKWLTSHPGLTGQLAAALGDYEINALFSSLVPANVPLALDVVELLRESPFAAAPGSRRLWPVEFHGPVVEFLLQIRREPKAAKAGLESLLRGVAGTRNRPFHAFLLSLWPAARELGPIFRDPGTFELMKELIEAHVPPGQIPLPGYSRGQQKPKPIARKAQKKKTKDGQDDAPPEELWLVFNAGLALLWPFFDTLFERAGLMQASRFRSDDSRRSAVLLLQHLAKGAAPAGEPELPLNKMLCGFPLEEPIDLAVPPGENWPTLCDGLLRAAVRQWPILGDTSLHTLRETFLMRAGNLIRKEKDWLLQVTEGPYDILVKHIPWTISVVNLSWLEKPLKIEWR